MGAHRDLDWTTFLNPATFPALTSLRLGKADSLLQADDPSGILLAPLLGQLTDLDCQQNCGIKLEEPRTWTAFARLQRFVMRSSEIDVFFGEVLEVALEHLPTSLSVFDLSRWCDHAQGTDDNPTVADTLRCALNAGWLALAGPTTIVVPDGGAWYGHHEPWRIKQVGELVEIVRVMGKGRVKVEFCPTHFDVM